MVCTFNVGVLGLVPQLAIVRDVFFRQKRASFLGAPSSTSPPLLDAQCEALRRPGLLNCYPRLMPGLEESVRFISHVVG